MATGAIDQFNFTREAFYAAKKALSPSGLGVWCYLADGYTYNKTAIAQLNGIDERSVRRGREELERKGYLINDIFYTRPQPRAEVIKHAPVMIIAQPAQYKYAGQF